MAAPPTRHYGMDWLRIGAFLLLILYHVGFNFTPWGYQTPSRGIVPFSEIPLLALSAWRLSLLFAISGYASAALLSREPQLLTFATSRLVRLGVPFAFAMVFVVPPQIWIGLVNGPGYPHGLAYFTLHDFFGFGPVMDKNLPVMMHMWFVLYLLVYTLALCAFLGLPERWRKGAKKRAEGLLAGPWLLPAGITFVFLVRLLPNGWTDQHAFFSDRAAHLHYGAMFAFGFLLRRSEPLRVAIARQWKLAALVALAGYAWVVGDDIAFPGNVQTPAMLDGPFQAARAMQSWATVIALFGIADRFWNHDYR
jgi:glucans biosynthesis protein C